MAIDAEQPDYTELVAWLQSEEESANDDALNDERAVALKFYNGEPFGDEEEGRSQIVTRDVAEVIDYMVASILRLMMSGDQIVEFEALDEQFKQILEEAAEAISQQFLQEQDGWRILHDCLKGGLLEKTQAIKCMVEEKKVRREAEVPASQIVQMQQDGTELLGAEQISEDPELGPIFRVAWIETEPKFVDVPLPNEEFSVARDARSLKDAVYYRHSTEVTLSDIRQMGLDADGLEYEASSYATTALSNARDGDNPRGTEYRDGANRKVCLREEYCRYDLNGDGIAEMLRVQRVGKVILSVNEIEYGLIKEWCPYPMPHRRVGQSACDKVMDLQRTGSVLLRQYLDALYQSNVPRMLVPENSLGDTTIDDLLTFRPGALIRYKGGQAPEPLKVDFVAGPALQALEMLKGERETRTGITRLNQGLDVNALSRDRTATEASMMQASGHLLEDYVARNFGQFVGDIFELKYRLMKDFGKPFRIVVDGQPVTVDPSQWPDDMRVRVRVGLGTGRKEQLVQNLMMILRLQQEAAQAEDPHVGPQQIAHTVNALVPALQLPGRGPDYYADPANDPPQDPNAPDPAAQAEMAKVQGQQQIEMAKLQAKMQADQAKHQADMQIAQAKHQLEQSTAMSRMELEQMKAQHKAQLERERAEFEAQLAASNAQFERMMQQERMASDHEVRMSKNRDGGELQK